jgi:hypothetical protein
MAKISICSWVLCLLCGAALAGDESGAPSSKLAVGYDEGLSAKYAFSKKWSAAISLGYEVVGADSAYKQPLSTALAKIGGQYCIAEFSKLRVGGFIDFVETMKEGQVAYTKMVGPYKVYYQWNSGARIGLSPELFLSDHVSISYKFGATVNYFGPTYKLNADESDLETRDNSYIAGGVYGFQGNTPFMFLQNIAVYVYF